MFEWGWNESIIMKGVMILLDWILVCMWRAWNEKHDIFVGVTSW